MVEMVELDHSLVDQARRLTTGANVHHVKTLIFCYEEAVHQQNDGRPYNLSFERSLRQFVRAQARSVCLKDFDVLS